jgi:C-terminal binding protein
MPKGAIVVNTARGDVVDFDGLERAMREDIISGAGLDVVPLEPIPDDDVHPLIQAYRRKETWLEGRLVITPHTAFYSPEAYDEIRVKSVECMRRVLIDGVRGLSGNEITPSME